MKPKNNSIGIIFKEIVQWYIIENNKARYISEDKWFEYYDKKYEINQPVYCEDIDERDSRISGVI